MGHLSRPMIRCIKKEQLIEASSNRKLGYLEEVERRKQLGNDPDLYCFTEEDFMFLRKNYSETKMPSLLSMAKNALGAIGSEVQYAATGAQQVSKEDIQARIDICNKCEFFTANIPELSEKEKAENRCVKCGCYMALKHKLSSSSCPVGKW